MTILQHRYLDLSIVLTKILTKFKIIFDKKTVCFLFIDIPFAQAIEKNEVFLRPLSRLYLSDIFVLLNVIFLIL